MNSIVELIEAKRDGKRHSESEIERLVLGHARDEVPDYQMSAWLMAAFLRGLDAEETLWLTRAMVASGATLDLSAVRGVKVDKHSTGGVGDTVTLVVAPLVAACGVPVAKMSGRGLGHTGGTLDKLESVPGLRTALASDEFARQVAEVGVAVMAQTAEVVPADRKLYALRDVTGTVPSAPLIVASIVSKKVAGGADAVLLDVKCGSGAFMKTPEEARALAADLVRVGGELGKRFAAVVTDMDVPLGDAIGNALEVAEAISTLRGEGSPRLAEACEQVAGRMLVLGGAATDSDEGVRLARAAVASGAALDKMREWFAAQGGDAAVVDDTSRLPHAPLLRAVRCPVGGYVEGFNAEGVGRAALALGAGRHAKDDEVDAGAGIVLHVRRGDDVSAGDTLAVLHASEESRLDEAEAGLIASVRTGPERPEDAPVVLEG